MQIQTGSLFKERTVTSLNFNITEGLKCVRKLYVMIEAAVENNDNLLRGGEVN